MPIPSNIQAVIDASVTLQSAESRLNDLKEEKNMHQDRIQFLNEKIDLVSVEVTAARLALKTAAQNI